MSKMLAVRLPDTLAENLEKTAVAVGISKSDVIRMCVMVSLGRIGAGVLPRPLPMEKEPEPLEGGEE